MPNPVFTYILNIWFVNTFCRYTRLNDRTVLFLKIQVNKVKWFQVLLCNTENSIKHVSFVNTKLNAQTVLFQTIQFIISHLFSQFQCHDPSIGPYQVLPLRAKVDQGRWKLRGTPHYPKLHLYWSLTIGLFNVIIKTLVGRRSYPSEEM